MPAKNKKRTRPSPQLLAGLNIIIIAAGIIGALDLLAEWLVWHVFGLGFSVVVILLFIAAPFALFIGGLSSMISAAISSKSLKTQVIYLVIGLIMFGLGIRMLLGIF